MSLIRLEPDGASGMLGGKEAALEVLAQARERGVAGYVDPRDRRESFGAFMAKMLLARWRDTIARGRVLEAERRAKLQQHKGVSFRALRAVLEQIDAPTTEETTAEEPESVNH